MSRLRSGNRRFTTVGLSAAILAVAVAIPVVSFGAAFGASAFVQPTVQYLQDSGSVLTFTVSNTGTSDSIGAVEIARPSTSFTVTACPEAPAGWTAQSATDKCRYRSATGSADDLLPGQTSSSFKLTSAAAGGKADYSGAWKVTVSKSDQFDDKSKLAAAASSPPGLTVKVHSFEILDAVVASSKAAIDGPCPAPSKQAIGGASQVIVICGKNRSTGTLTPTAAQSSLAGTFIASSGTFSSGKVAPKSSSSRVLANWENAQVSGSKGTDKTVIAKIGASSKETSPLTTLGGYEVTNQAPTADAKTITGVAEDVAKSIGLSADDADGDNLTFSIVGQPSHGTLGLVTGTSCSGSPSHCTASVVYTPNVDYNGTDGFTYRASDSFSNSTPVSVSITVDPVNDVPMASPATFSAAEDDAATAINLAGAVADVETSDANLTYTIVSGPSHGQLTGTGASKSYAPSANYNGPDSFTFKVTDRGDPDNCGTAHAPDCDGPETSTVETVGISVGPVNDAPTASSPSVSVAEDEPKAIDLATLAADVETADANLTFEILDAPDHGTYTGGTYSPTSNYHGSDSFTFKVTDRGDPDNCSSAPCAPAKSATGTVSITVDAVNDTPTAIGKSVSLAEDAPGGEAIALGDLVSDVETSDANLTYTIVSGPSSGQLTGTGGSKTYTPNANYSGPDSFTYTVTDRGDPDNCGTPDADCDAAETSTTAVVLITVVPVNDAPSVADATVFIDEDTSWAINLADLVDDVETSDANLTYTIVSGPANGQLTGTGASRSYAPAENFNGSDSFTYKVTDGGDPDGCGAAAAGCSAALTSTTKTVSITVSAVNDAPVNTVPEGPLTAIQETATNVAGLSVADVDAGTQSVELDLSVAHGKLTLDALVPSGVTAVTGNGTSNVVATGTLAQLNTTLAATDGLRYTGATGYTGSDTLTVLSKDLGHTGSGGALSDTDTLAITVRPPNFAPVADAKTVSTTEEAAKTITLTATDADGDDPLSFATGTASHGSVGAVGTVTCDHQTPNACSADVLYTPDTDFSGSDSFTYTASDGADNSDAVTVAITVDPVNDAPNIAGIETTALSYTENDAAKAITSTATVADVDSANFDTGQLTVDYSVGGTPDDRIEIASQGNLPGEIGVLGSAVSYGGTQIGTFSGGSGTTPLVVTLDADATPTSVQALLRAISFRNVSENPSTAARTARFVLSDGDGGTSAPVTRAIEVTAVHDVPVLAAIEAAGLSYTENGSAIAVTSALTVSDADSNVTGGAVSIGNFAAGDRLNFVNTASITGAYSSATGVLTLSGTASATDYQAALRSITYDSTSEDPGTATRTVTFQVKDGPNAGDLSNTQAREIAVTAVNDAPVVTSGGTLSYTENDPATAVHSGLTLADAENHSISGASASITAGYAGVQDSLSWVDNDGSDNITLDGGNSSAQTVVLTGLDSVAKYQAALRAVKYANSSDNPATANRTVTFNATDQPGATGSATRTISVTAVDDPPVAVNDGATLLEDAAATSVTVLSNDTDVDGGAKAIASATDPANGTVVLTGGSPGQHTGLTYQPDPNYCNDPPGTTKDTFTYTLNGGSTATVSMTVTCVNDAPVADDETFNGNDSAIGNTTLQVDAPGDDKAAPGNPHTEIAGNILDGDSDVDGPGPLTVTPETRATNDGGSVTIEADGDFVFQPAPATSCTDTSDFFDYTVEDSGSPEQTDTGRVTIAIAGCVWYVQNNDPAGNSGTSAAPFDTLAQAETASGANHTVFVFDGDNTATGYGGDGYAMNSGERLIGEHEGLTVDPDGGGALTADTLRAANPGAHPTLTATNADVIDLDDGNEVRGFNLDPDGTGGGIAGTTGDTGGGTIDDVNIVDGGTAGTQPGLELNATTGTFNISNLVVNNKATGVLLANAGTVNFTPASQISITTAGAKGLDAAGTNLGTSTFDDITVTASPAGGVRLDTTTGTVNLGDGVGTDLNLTTASGSAPALGIVNGGSVTVDSAGTDDLHATGGPALDVTGTSGPTLAFDDVDSTNSASDGINLDGLGAGTFSASSGDVTGAAGISFDLNGGSGAITYPGTFGNGSGATAFDITGRSGGTVSLAGSIADTNDAGGGINLASNTAGSTILSGAPKQFNTVAGDAVLFNNSDGHTFALSGGGLDIDTTTGKGLESVTAGTLQVSGSTNTIDTTTGRALNVDSTDIASGGLTLERLSSNGAPNGIRLNSTGNLGSLVITSSGTGTCPTADLTTPAPTNATCTGGVIANSTLSGISLTNVPSAVELTRMAVTNSADHGINASGVDDFELNRSVVMGNGNVGSENGLNYVNVTGVSSVMNSDLLNNNGWNARVENSSGTLHLTVQGNDIQNALNEDGVQVNANGTANMRSTVTQNDFKDNKGDAIQYGTTAPAAPPASVTDATVTSNVIDGNPGTTIDGGIVFGPDGVVRGTVSNNTVKNVSVSAIILNPFGTANNTTTDITANNNTIGTAGVQQSGSADGDGMQLKSPTDGTAKVVMSNNQIRGWQGAGMRLRASESTNNASTHLTAQGNVIGDEETGAADAAIWLQSGSSSADVVNFCANVGGAGALANSFTNAPVTGPAGIADFVLDLRFANATMRLPGYTGTTAANRQSYFFGRNTGFTTFAQDGTQNPQNESDGACDQPVAPSLPTAPTPTS